MPFLKHDIASAIRPSNIYGFKGEEVEIISYRGNVVVVKGPTCAKFSVMLSELDNVPENLEQSPPLEEHVPKPPKSPKISKIRRSPGTPGPIDQATLF